MHTDIALDDFLVFPWFLAEGWCGWQGRRGSHRSLRRPVPARFPAHGCPPVTIITSPPAGLWLSHNIAGMHPGCRGNIQGLYCQNQIRWIAAKINKIYRDLVLGTKGLEETVSCLCACCQENMPLLHSRRLCSHGEVGEGVKGLGERRALELGRRDSNPGF